MSHALKSHHVVNQNSEELDFSGGRSLDAVWTNKSLELVQKLILLFFAKKCDFKGNFKDVIFVSIDSLAKQIGASKQTTITHLTILKTQGYLSVMKESHKKRLYSLTDKIFDEYRTNCMAKGLSTPEANLKRFFGGRSLNAIWDLNLKSSAKAFLLWLGSKCNFTKSFLSSNSYSLEFISRELNLKKDALISMVKSLELKGLIFVRKAYKKVHQYSLTFKVFIRKDKDFSYESKIPTQGSNESHFPIDESKFQTLNESKKQTHSPKEILLTPSPFGTPERKEKSDRNSNEAFEITRFLMRTGFQERFIGYIDSKKDSKILLSEFGIEVLRRLETLSNQSQKRGFTFKQIEFYCKKIRSGMDPFEKSKQVLEKTLELENETLVYLKPAYDSQIKISEEHLIERSRESIQSMFVKSHEDFKIHLNQFLMMLKPVQLSFFKKESETMNEHKFKVYFENLVRRQYQLQ